MYLVILDYTNGVTNITTIPQGNDNEDYANAYIEDNFKGCTTDWMACNSLDINV